MGTIRLPHQFLISCKLAAKLRQSNVNLRLRIPARPNQLKVVGLIRAARMLRHHCCRPQPASDCPPMPWPPDGSGQDHSGAPTRDRSATAPVSLGPRRDSRAGTGRSAAYSGRTARKTSTAALRRLFARIGQDRPCLKLSTLLCLAYPSPFAAMELAGVKSYHYAIRPNFSERGRAYKASEMLQVDNSGYFNRDLCPG